MAKIVILSDPVLITSLHSQASEVANWSTKGSPAGCLLADRCVVNSVPLTLASELFIWVICLEFWCFSVSALAAVYTQTNRDKDRGCACQHTPLPQADRSLREEERHTCVVDFA